MKIAPSFPMRSMLGVSPRGWSRLCFFPWHRRSGGRFGKQGSDNIIERNIRTSLDQDRDTVEHGRPSIRRRAYRKVAAEYKGLSEETADQFLRSYYRRIADDYMERVDREARALLREGSSALPGAADEPGLS
jgi:hypothetical protein